MTLLNDSNLYHVHHGDCIPHMLEDMPAASVDFSVFSPPFPSLFAYTSKAEDIGIIIKKEEVEKLEVKIGGKVPCSITNFLGQAEFVVRFGWGGRHGQWGKEGLWERLKPNRCPAERRMTNTGPALNRD